MSNRTFEKNRCEELFGRSLFGWCVFGFSCVFTSGSAFRFGDAGLINDGNENVSGKSRDHTVGKFEIGDGNRVSHFKVLDIGVNDFGKIFWSTGDFQIADHLLENSTGLHSDRLTMDFDWKTCGDCHSFGHGEEISVDQRSGQRIVLGALKESGLGFSTVNLEINKNTLGSTVCEHVGQGLGIDLDVEVFLTLSVYHGGKKAFTAHLLENTRTSALAGSCG